VLQEAVILALLGYVPGFLLCVLSNTRHMMEMLALQNRKGDLVRQVIDLPLGEFTALREQVTEEAGNFRRVSEMAKDDTFESMLDPLRAAARSRGPGLRRRERAGDRHADAGAATAL
jgi:hypothetical protein